MYMRKAKVVGIMLALALPLSTVQAVSAQDVSAQEVAPQGCVHQKEGVPYAAVAVGEQLLADGVIDEELANALEDVDAPYVIEGPRPRALPVVAALAVAGAAWCVKGALGSLVPSALQQMAHQAHDGIEPPTWVTNAVFGCAAGPVLGALASQAMRLKFVAAVLSAVIKLRNFG